MITDFPRTANDAFYAAKTMAVHLGISFNAFVREAKVSPAAIYNWRTKKGSYSPAVFTKLHDLHAKKKRK